MVSQENERLMTRFLQFFLGLDGVLHGLEVLSAYAERAWVTFSLTLVHALVFLFAAYFVGQTHTHNHCHDHGDNEIATWKKVTFAIVILLVILMFTPLGESLHLIETHEH
jgi:hypothetical protein